MRGRLACGWLALVAMMLGGGCGGSNNHPSSAGESTRGARTVKFVGFDASPPLIDALRQKKLLGVVVQNPLRMGALGVKTMVQYLEKQPIEKEVSTGETLVTPENMDDPKIKALLEPAKVPNEAETSRGGERKKWRVMVIPKGTTHEFWQSIHAGALQAAEELGNVEVIWKGPLKEDDRTEQIGLVQTAVARRVDGIVLAPLDAKALVGPVEQAIDRGIPVVIIDSSLDSKKPISYVATNNYNGGVLAARRLGEVLGGTGKIILLRYAQGSASTEERERGFTDTIAKEYPKITYLSQDQYAGATSDKAQQVAQTLVTRYRGQVDGIFCPNESSTFGMLRALEGAGMVAATRP